MTDDKRMLGKPKVTNSLAEKEIDKAIEQFEAFDNNIKSMTMDRMNQAPKEDVEIQTKIAQSDLSKTKDLYIKPKRTIGSREKFNERYRAQYEFDKEYVNFIAENKEIIGETLEFWTKPYAGMPAEEWAIPCNKPLWAPRYVAEQIKRKSYHRLVMQDRPTGADGMGSYYGTMTVDTKIQRLDAHPVSSRKSIFMGSHTF